MSRSKRVASRQAQILEAAQRAFAEKGYLDSTIADVAREAGLSEATVYEYFSSKDEILFSIPLEPTHRLHETLERQLQYVRGARGKIRTTVYHCLSFYQDHPEFAAVVLLILIPNRRFYGTESYKKTRQVLDLMEQIIKEGVDSGELDASIDPLVARVMLSASITQLTFRWLILGRAWDLLEHVDPLSDLIFNGINAKTGLEGWNVRITVEPPAPAVRLGSQPSQSATKPPDRQSGESTGRQDTPSRGRA
jgi:AcrR family transcriptional regulator